MLEVKNLFIEIDNKIIINDLSFILNKNDKMAIIGEEGNGKSTLLKTIYDQHCIDYTKVKGSINKKGNHIGYLEQMMDSKYFEWKVFDYLFLNNEDYYNKINDYYRLLNELNLKETHIDNLIGNLSGGEKIKVQILKILLDNVDILLLDEPTNDLDIETLSWLEEFINSCNKPILFVSHDEYLLAKTANIILHLELVKKKTESRWTVVKCDYNTYVEKRLNSIKKNTQIAKKESVEFKKQQAKLRQIMDRVHHEQATISRADPHGGKMLKKKMKSIKSQERKLENKELTPIPDYEEPINIFFEKVKLPNKKIIADINIPTLKIDNTILSKDINLKVRGNEHIVIIGQNGTGKTTLIKYIYEKLKPRTDIRLGYMSQNYDDVLDGEITPINYLSTNNQKENISLIRQYMGNISFTKNEMTEKIKNLSGGSKAKLILLKFIINQCDVLLLDEPTRNVSPLSNPIIRQILSDFDGTIISISHDRKYIEEVCSQMYELTKSGLKLL